MSFTLIGEAGGTATTVAYVTNNAGDALIAIFAASATTGDFVQPPMTILDAANNMWYLKYSNINVTTGVGNPFVALALYACDRCVQSIGNSISMPTELTPVDVLTTWTSGAEYQYTFASLSFAVADYESSKSIDFAMQVPIPTLGDPPQNPLLYYLGIGCAFDVALVGTPSITNAGVTSLGVNVPNSCVGFNQFNTTLIIDSSGVVIAVNGSTNVFGVFVALIGSNATGGGNSTTLVFSINKGPNPQLPPEGRAIATVEIDCTQQPVHTLPANYAEYVFNPINGEAPEGYTLCEFDLSVLFQGSGLSEVRTLTAWSRPGFNYDGTNRQDNAGGSASSEQAFIVFPALLTNTVTMQTIALGENAALSNNVYSGVSFGQFCTLPFPGNKNSLKYRFICPQYYSNNPVGKFTLQFYNFELLGSVDSNAAPIGYGQPSTSL